MRWTEIFCLISDPLFKFQTALSSALITNFQKVIVRALSQHDNDK